uniref:Proteasome subunit beta type-4 n=1 Tax=Solanum lycopersicum TaxID=4081 RepID=A0A3Q7IZW2_SOLLC
MNVMDSAPAKSSLMSPESDIQRTQCTYVHKDAGEEHWIWRKMFQKGICKLYLPVSAAYALTGGFHWDVKAAYAFKLLDLIFIHAKKFPYVTGTSVVGIKYKDGILLAADMGGSYGSTIRYKSVDRLKPVGKHSLLGASGEISDFQEIMKYLDELILYDNMWDDGNSLGPKEVHNYLTRVMYNRRNKFNPLWNSLVLGGVKNGQKYLGTVSMIGVHYEDNHVATGFGNHLARPILRDEWHENLSYEEGVKLLEKCMRVLLYRDRSAVNKLQIAKITEEGVTISQPYSLKTFWNFSAFQNPTVGAEGSWFDEGTTQCVADYRTVFMEVMFDRTRIVIFQSYLACHGSSQLWNVVVFRLMRMTQPRYYSLLCNTSELSKCSDDFGLAGGSDLGMDKLGERPKDTNCFPMSVLNGRDSCRLSTGSEPSTSGT